MSVTGSDYDDIPILFDDVCNKSLQF